MQPSAFIERFSLLLKVSRPLVGIAGLMLFLTGFYVSGAEFTVIVALNMLTLLLFPLIIFGVNDIYDYETDIFSKRKHSLAEGYILPKANHAFIKKACLTAVLIIAGFSFATLNISNISATLFALFLAYAYSAPPIRLKERPLLDSLSNAAAVIALLAMGYSYGGTLFNFPAKLAYASLGAAAMHAIGAVLDYDNDRKAGLTTIATFFGKRFASFFATAVMASILLFSGIKSIALNSYLVFMLFVCFAIFLFPFEKLVRRLSVASFIGFLVALSLFLRQTFK